MQALRASVQTADGVGVRRYQRGNQRFIHMDIGHEDARDEQGTKPRAELLRHFRRAITQRYRWLECDWRRWSQTLGAEPAVTPFPLCLRFGLVSSQLTSKSASTEAVSLQPAHC